MIDKTVLDKYWVDEKLDDLLSQIRPDKDATPPMKMDLARLHYLIRQRKCFTVMEFGVGMSTYFIADALYKNRADWNALADIPKLRNSHLFKCFSVDASEKWIAHTNRSLPAYLKDIIVFNFSKVRIGTWQDQVCHFYDKLPDVIPDFIYLDAPDPHMVEGEIGGMSFQCAERTVMSGDLLRMESTMLPGTFIIVDGRTNNVRFLKNNFKRKFEFEWDRDGDISTFELNEERLGPYNLLGSDFFDTHA